jgi:hypothetical protein
LVESIQSGIKSKVKVIVEISYALGAKKSITADTTEALTRTKEANCTSNSTWLAVWRYFIV